MTLESYVYVVIRDGNLVEVFGNEYDFDHWLSDIGPENIDEYDISRRCIVTSLRVEAA